MSPPRPLQPNIRFTLTVQEANLARQALQRWAARADLHPQSLIIQSLADRFEQAIKDKEKS